MFFEKLMVNLNLRSTIAFVFVRYVFVFVFVFSFVAGICVCEELMEVVRLICT